ncbi:MAG TPA: pseudouridine-5'-phosphate glycosidase [Bacilli bacterium]|nr:pseudouridine-5'-phosphate glycosidase [Bacilli bacterium]
MTIKLSKEVENALANGKPIIALESTIISHGMPYPDNVKTALMVEKFIRERGAVPATIAVIAGEIRAGLTADEIDELGKKKDVVKVSRRDLAYVVSQKRWGGTTVAATMIIAKRAGIKVFVTGGIGGVHRGASDTFDISADLDELGKTNIAVVSAGPKAILDLNKTLEYLETKGVPIIGYQTTKMPLFYTMSESEEVLYRFEEASDIATYIKAHNQLNLENGVLIFNAISAEDALPYTEVENAIDQAIREMKRAGISGKEETPYLLSKVAEITKGRSLKANISLLLSNVALGVEIAKALTNNEN